MQISRKNFSGKILDHQLHINFAMKIAAKMINKHGHLYLVNWTMWDKLNFISHTLSPDSEIQFKTPIAHLILRIPTASIVGDSSLTTCGGYSVTLKFWWHLSFPETIVVKMLLHLKDNSNKSFISINCLEYETIILNYCDSIVAFATNKLNNNPHLAVLCMTDNTSALNWTLHTSKKSMIGRALARFFVASWLGQMLAQMQNGSALSKISLPTRYQGSKSSTQLLWINLLPTYDYTNLQQGHKELKACTFFQPSHKLVLLLWDILLMQKMSQLKSDSELETTNLGKQCTLNSAKDTTSLTPVVSKKGTKSYRMLYRKAGAR
jgi:hypothetical protein